MRKQDVAALIPLTRLKFALVSPEDYEQARSIKWQTVVSKGGEVCYAHSKPLGYMHKWLTGWDETDHVNGDGLDNRRSNLRPATRSQNKANSRRSSRNTSGHVGVSWHKPQRGSHKWIVHVGKQHVGRFDDFDVAVDAYHVAAWKAYGEFAPNCCEHDRSLVRLMAIPDYEEPLDTFKDQITIAMDECAAQLIRNTRSQQGKSLRDSGWIATAHELGL